MTGSQLLRLPRTEQVQFWNEGRRQQLVRRFRGEPPNSHPRVLAYDTEQVRREGGGSN